MHFRIIYNMSEIVTGCNFVFFILFSDPDKGGGGEGGKQSAVRERCFSPHCTLCCCFHSDLSFTVLKHHPICF